MKEEAKSYKERNPDYEISNVKSILTKEEVSVKERAAGKPVKPPSSSYSLYSSQLLKSEEIKSVPAHERMNVIANRWRNCPEEEKQVYRDRVAVVSLNIAFCPLNFLISNLLDDGAIQKRLPIILRHVTRSREEPFESESFEKKSLDKN